MAKDPRIDTGTRSRQLPPEAHIRMHFERFSTFVEEYSSKLSLSGMFVTTRDPRPVGSEVAFDLKLADGFRLFHGHGQVAWVRLEDGGSDAPVGMALRFVALDEKGRELVLKVLEEQLKAGGLPFEIDPPPPGALLDFDAGAAEYPGVVSAGQPQLPMANDFTEEPTIVTAKRRALDETGFDAPWGQKLPEVPTDLLDENEEPPSIPSVSEVVFDSAPAAPVFAPAAAANAAPAGASLFAAAFPGRSSGAESPEGLGFVLDENLAPSASEVDFSPENAFADFEAQNDVSWDLGDGGASAGVSELAPSPGEIPFEPDPEDFNFDSEEPTLMSASAAGEEPTQVGSRSSVLPAEGFFSVGPGASPPPPVAASPAPVAPTSTPIPTFAAPSPPPVQPSLFDSWESPPEPAKQVVAPPEIEAFTPFDLGARPSEPSSPPGPSRAGYTGLGVPTPPAESSYVPEEEQWAEYEDYEEAPSRGGRFMEALRSRKALLGLVATAVVVTAAYFLAGNLLFSADEKPLASGPKPGARPPGRAKPPISAPANEAVRPAEGAGAGPEHIVAQPETVAAEPNSEAPARQLPATTTEDAAPSRSEPLPSRSEPLPSRSELAAPRADSARRSAARWLLKIELRRNAGQTIVELVFDGEMDRSLFEHNPMAYDSGKDQLAFRGIEGSRSPNREVGSPELVRIRMGQHPGELRVVFDHPAGIRLSAIEPDGERLRVVLER